MNQESHRDRSDLDPRFKFAYLISASKAESLFLLALASAFLGLGFLFADGSNSNYQMIYAFASKYAWGVFFLLYSASKFCAYFFRIDYKVKLASGVLGLWAWNYLLLSFTMFDITPITPAEILLILPVLVESWILLSNDNKDNKDSNQKRTVREGSKYG